MSDERVLAIVLVAGAGLILILIIAIICIIMKCVNTKTKNTTSHSVIPMSKMNQQYYNYGVQHDGKTTTTKNNQTKTTENPDGEHKAEWPSDYNMYAVSRSYDFPKTGEPVNPSNGSRPASVISTKSYEISHKTFSEEVFEGLKQATHPTASVSSAGTDQKRPHSGVWKYHHHTPSQTPSQHSMDKTSIASSSTASHPPEYYHSDEKQQSYYSTFKSKKARDSMSKEIQASQNGSNNGTATTLTTKIFTQSQRQRISSQTVNSEGEKKVFTFSIK